ncbi:hypothetical protein [Citrobacter koseri]|uniref:hypothetical protein n=1 Tax=Citrobacter koseri TaxID=545 RepID=UPI00215DB165|nr:hypothetical protein [Citrobacter koseri]
MDAALSPVSGRTPADGLFYEPKRFRNIYQVHDSTLIFEYEQLTTYRQSLKAGKRTELISGPQHICQSGRWKSAGSGNGEYSSIGTFKGQYAGINSTGSPFKLYAIGGKPPGRKINDGNADDCANTFALAASVDGINVAKSVNANSNWSKSGTIVFDVPVNASFSITSDNMRNYGCDYGSFVVVRYQ